MFAPHIIEPPDAFAPPKPVKDARAMLWIQVVINAISLALFLPAFFRTADDAKGDAAVAALTLILALSVVLMALMVLSAVLILKRLAWVYVVTLGIQALSIIVLVLDFGTGRILAIFLAGYIGFLLLRPESRRWFFPPRTP